jgi:hypothetical protein
METIAANQHDLTKDGGRLLISSSMGVKSFSFASMPDMTPSTISDMALKCWITVKDMTDAQLEAWLTKPIARTVYTAFV